MEVDTASDRLRRLPDGEWQTLDAWRLKQLQGIAHAARRCVEMVDEMPRTDEVSLLAAEMRALLVGALGVIDDPNAS